jgi:hypothetical protein
MEVIKLINAIYTDDDNNISMIEINNLVYSIDKKQNTIQPIGNTCFIQELNTDNEYIHIIQDSNSLIVSVQFKDNTIYEFRTI